MSIADQIWEIFTSGKFVVCTVYYILSIAAFNVFKIMIKN